MKYKTLKNKLNNRYVIWLEGECYDCDIPFLLPYSANYDRIKPDLRKPENYKLVTLDVKEV